MPGIRRKVTFIKLKIFRSERRNMLFQWGVGGIYLTIYVPSEKETVT
jgi:hypothetical protein